MQASHMLWMQSTTEPFNKEWLTGTIVRTGLWRRLYWYLRKVFFIKWLCKPPIMVFGIDLESRDRLVEVVGYVNKHNKIELTYVGQRK